MQTSFQMRTCPDAGFCRLSHTSIFSASPTTISAFITVSPHATLTTASSESTMAKLSVSAYLNPAAWVLEPEPSTFAPSSRWSNKDMDPVPPKGRTWTTFNYIAYWLSDATNVAVWELASSMLAIGLSWRVPRATCASEEMRQAIPAIAIGHIIISVVMVLNGTIGARLHVGFPVLNRSSFGFWFSYFSVISRVVLSMFWFGIQTYTGSECVYQMLKAIWPSIAHLRNHLAPGANITTAAWLAMLIWAFVKVPSNKGLFEQHTTLSGSALSYAWLSALNSALGLYSTLAVNIPDFTSTLRDMPRTSGRQYYSQTPGVISHLDPLHRQYIQLLIIPTAFTLFGFMGIAVTSASQVLYGEVIWDPLQLIGRWDNRAAAFFASFSFVLATLGTNISANSLSAANDMTVLFPRYINIRRGQVICAILGGWALCPWEILASTGWSTNAVSMCPPCTVRTGAIATLTASADPHVCTVVELARGRRYPVLRAAEPPRADHSINPKIDVGGAMKIFDFAWLFGFTVASVVYTVLSVLFPAEETFIPEAITFDDAKFHEESAESTQDEKKSIEAEVDAMS
ncbi:hypothetical protein A0H81_08039 [Grifola frondosa]|uniref:Uracil permease n=1 Tax=Grifola frondosa TaxID=5627 RepID=A0A1C7M6L8_GRIFR|nr:hypothetical protein A0H81_08039 [Grifola frondosa]